MGSSVHLERGAVESGLEERCYTVLPDGKMRSPPFLGLRRVGGRGKGLNFGGRWGSGQNFEA